MRKCLNAASIARLEFFAKAMKIYKTKLCNSMNKKIQNKSLDATDKEIPNTNKGIKRINSDKGIHKIFLFSTKTNKVQIIANE